MPIRDYMGEVLRAAVCLGLLTLLPPQTLWAQEQHEQTGTTADGLNYLITLPDAYDAEAEQAYPLLLFLHGGDRSNTRHHPQKYAQGEGIVFPFIVLAPHCTSGCSWSSVDFDALLQEVVAAYRVDATRIYLTGYSMGGYGAWSLLSHSPHWFAAAAPIAGGGDPARICKAKAVAIRAYHGDRDTVVPHTRSEQMISALQDCGAEATLILYPDGDHGSWIPTFKDPAFYQWLLRHKKAR